MAKGGPISYADYFINNNGTLKDYEIRLIEILNNIEKAWEKYSEKLAYYIEHNELEKVDTEIVKAKADIEVQNYAIAIENLERCTFILEHIKDKNSLKIVNVF